MKGITFFRLREIVIVLILITTNFFIVSRTSAQNPKPEGTVGSEASLTGLPAGLTVEDWDQITRSIASSFDQQAYLKAANADAGDYFGYSVAISGDTIVVGALYEDGEGDNIAGDAGAAYVFVREGTAWTQQAYLKASNVDFGDYFGYSVAISGDTIVVGAYGEDGDGSSQADDSANYAGAAYVFVREGTDWTQQAYLKASNVGGGDQFGYSVAVSGDTIVVGALYKDGTGAAYVFVREGTAWIQQAYLKASIVDGGDYFGRAVAISGDTLVVGADGEDGNRIDGEEDDSTANSGAAYVFVREGTAWTQQAYLKASNVDEGDTFGYAVAISGDSILVGAPYEDGEGDNIASDAGTAYVFVREGMDWTQQAYLKASNVGADDYFGRAVAISGDTIVLGAPLEDGEGDNIADRAGAAYVFVREGMDWTQQAYLKASIVGEVDFFGRAVALSGDTVLVGAPAEDGDGTSPEDDSATAAGAAYVFSKQLFNYLPLFMR